MRSVAPFQSSTQFTAFMSSPAGTSGNMASRHGSPAPTPAAFSGMAWMSGRKCICGHWRVLALVSALASVSALALAVSAGVSVAFTFDIKF